jgi:hypothetical protein
VCVLFGLELEEASSASLPQHSTRCRDSERDEAHVSPRQIRTHRKKTASSGYPGPPVLQFIIR